MSDKVTALFTTKQIMAMMPPSAFSHEWFSWGDAGVDTEQASAARMFVYIPDRDGKVWRFDPKTDTDGGDELSYEIECLMKKPDDVCSSWDAAEVELKVVSVKKYVPVTRE
jgi:hypothetical protein